MQHNEVIFIHFYILTIIQYNNIVNKNNTAIIILANKLQYIALAVHQQNCFKSKSARMVPETMWTIKRPQRLFINTLKDRNEPKQ